MPACLSRRLDLPTQLPAGALKMQDDHLPGLADHFQGIISILPSSTTATTITSTANISALRRTLSADMSSKKFMAQSGIRKIPSAEHLHEVEDDSDNGGSGAGDGPGSGSLAFEEIWSSIQRDQRNKEESDLPRQTNIWSSILSTQKANDGDKASLPPPYVHPLVKRSASSLSEKSLEICTESLGSETGSDCFSSYPASELCDSEQEEREKDDQNQNHNQPQQQEEEPRVPAARYAATKAAPRAFPPPLPSIAHRGDGSNLHMRSHRQNGRLVLEAVSVPSHNCFRAQRQDGRLLLTFSDNHPSSGPGDDEIDENGSREEEEEEDQESYWEEEDKEVEEEDEEKVERENEATDDVGAIGMVSYVHKFLSLTRSNTPPWPRRLNKVVATLEGSGGCGDGPAIQAAASDAAAGGCLNSYVCSWRSNPAAMVEVVQQVGPNRMLELDHHQQGKSVVVMADQGKRAAEVEYLVPLLRGCNQQQPRGRSLLIWEPHCIATS